MVEETIFNDNNRTRQVYKLNTSQIPCLRCGTCCSKFQPQLDLPNAHFIANKLAVSWEHFQKEYTDPRWPGTRNFLIRHIKGACIFLRVSSDKRQKLCLIHAFKPSCCLEWKAGIYRSECLEGLKKNWDLSVDSSGRIQGARKKIEAFERFVLSVKNPPPTPRFVADR